MFDVIVLISDGLKFAEVDLKYIFFFNKIRNMFATDNLRYKAGDGSKPGICIIDIDRFRSETKNPTLPARQGAGQ